MYQEPELVTMSAQLTVARILDGWENSGKYEQRKPSEDMLT